MFKILQVTNKGPMMSAQKVYQQFVNEDEGGPRHVINTPRDQNQIKNFQKDENRQFRISHDGIYNTYQLCFQLQLKDRKGEPQNFLRNFQVYPTVCVHMVPHPLLENLEMLLKVSTTPVTLHYDTVFNMGDFYLSTLVFRNAIFKKDPITPVAFFIHSRRFQEDHMLFMKTIRKSLPLLASKKILMVTDREFDFSDVFPMCLNVFCWNHLELDLHFYLKNSANCKPSEISYYANSFKALMIEENEDDFDSSWSITKASFTNPTVLRYFEQKLLPAFKEHSSIWKLREMGVSDPENGLTNNPSESMNAVLHNLQQWKQVPLDVICVSLFHLSSYYQREIIRAYHLCGSWQLKEELSYLQRDASLMPFLPKAIDPKEIVAKAGDRILPSYEEASPCSFRDDTTASVSSDKATCKLNSQLALAREAVHDKRVGLTEMGCWIVRGADNETPYAVRLFPKETCSCPSVKKCYHIIACKLMIGQDISDHTKPNMTLLTQRVRQKNKERPSGRKPPRKRDFNQVAANSKFIVFPIDVYIFLYFHVTDVNDSEGEGETVHNSHQSMEQKDGRNIGSTSIVLSYIHV